MELFLKTKKETKLRMLELTQELENKYDVVIKNFRCDNAGENVDTKAYLAQHGFNPNFEYTAKGTPQHKGDRRAQVCNCVRQDSSYPTSLWVPRAIEI